MNGGATPLNREALWLTGYNTSAELYQYITKVNAIRKQAIATNIDYIDTAAYVVYSDSSTIVMRKGVENRQVIAIFSSNGESGGAYTLDLPTAFEAGIAVTEILTCTNYTTSTVGSLTVPMDAGLPRIFFPSAHMNGSNMCGFANGSATSVWGSSAPSSPSISSISTLCLSLFAVMLGAWML